MKTPREIEQLADTIKLLFSSNTELLNEHQFVLGADEKFIDVAVSLAGNTTPLAIFKGKDVDYSAYDETKFFYKKAKSIEGAHAAYMTLHFFKSILRYRDTLIAEKKAILEELFKELIANFSQLYLSGLCWTFGRNANAFMQNELNIFFKSAVRKSFTWSCGYNKHYTVMRIKKCEGDLYRVSIFNRGSYSVNDTNALTKKAFSEILIGNAIVNGSMRCTKSYLTQISPKLIELGGDVSKLSGLDFAAILKSLDLNMNDSGLQLGLEDLDYLKSVKMQKRQVLGSCSASSLFAYLRKICDEHLGDEAGLQFYKALKLQVRKDANDNLAKYLHIDRITRNLNMGLLRDKIPDEFTPKIVLAHCDKRFLSQNNYRVVRRNAHQLVRQPSKRTVNLSNHIPLLENKDVASILHFLQQKTEIFKANNVDDALLAISRTENFKHAWLNFLASHASQLDEIFWQSLYKKLIEKEQTGTQLKAFLNSIVFYARRDPELYKQMILNTQFIRGIYLFSQSHPNHKDRIYARFIFMITCIIDSPSDFNDILRGFDNLIVEDIQNNMLQVHNLADFANLDDQEGAYMLYLLYQFSTMPPSHYTQLRREIIPNFFSKTRMESLENLSRYATSLAGAYENNRDAVATVVEMCLLINMEYLKRYFSEEKTPNLDVKASDCLRDINELLDDSNTTFDSTMLISIFEPELCMMLLNCIFINARDRWEIVNNIIANPYFMHALIAEAAATNDTQKKILSIQLFSIMVEKNFQPNNLEFFVADLAQNIGSTLYHFRLGDITPALAILLHRLDLALQYDELMYHFEDELTCASKATLESFQKIFNETQPNFCQLVKACINADEFLVRLETDYNLAIVDKQRLIDIIIPPSATSKKPFSFISDAIKRKKPRPLFGAEAVLNQFIKAITDEKVLDITKRRIEKSLSHVEPVDVSTCATTPSHGV